MKEYIWKEFDIKELDNRLRSAYFITENDNIYKKIFSNISDCLRYWCLTGQIPFDECRFEKACMFARSIPHHEEHIKEFVKHKVPKGIKSFKPTKKMLALFLWAAQKEAKGDTTYKEKCEYF